MNQEEIKKFNFDKHNAVTMTDMKYKKDRPQAPNPIKIQDLTFRDGHQSIFATRGRTEDMLPVAELIDQVGFYSMEVWGGATFDTMHRFLGEDPWERIRTLKKHIKNTPFSMLLRGQNLVGYRNYADDIVEAFVQRACDNGIDIFRVFDALNDFRNFETALKIIKKNGKHFQGTICYSLTEYRMGGEIYNIDYYLQKGKQLEEMGAETVCIKDMAGLISPYDAYNLVKALKAHLNVPIHLHTHFTSGMGDLAIFKAIEAGVDLVDTCLAPYAYRTSHPAVEPIVVSLYGTSRDTGFDIELLAEIDRQLEKVTPKYRCFLDDTKMSIIDTNVILHQTPGGMLSNLVNQLRQMNALDKLDEVFEILPEVRKDLGQVPLVTPTSQIVGIQAVNNVLFDSYRGEYKNITEQVKDLCYGLYGATPAPINPEVQKRALKDYPRGEKPISVRPGDVLEPELPKVEKEVEGLAKDLDDVLIVALYPVTGKKFLKWKYGLEEIPAEVKPRTDEDCQREQELIKKALAGELVEKSKKETIQKPENLRSFNVFVDDEYFKVEVEVDQHHPVKVSANPGTIATPKTAPVVKRPAPTPAKPQAKPAQPAKDEVHADVGEDEIVAPIPGMVVEYKVQVGDTVKAGDTVVVLEAMKMYNNLTAHSDGIVKLITKNAGDNAGKDEVLCIIEKI
ncbi:MAG: pyruvate carboxylase subunit B [Candidatus Cloacimonetes bacterium]|nr:pyruvate carboxylase subunit B [Candidatus Cloacimonadota bacterium]